MSGFLWEKNMRAPLIKNDIRGPLGKNIRVPLGNSDIRIPLGKNEIPGFPWERIISEFL